MNKKKIILTIAILGNVILCSGALVFATQDTIQNSILAKGIKLSNDDARQSIVTIDNSESKLSLNEVVKLVSKYESYITQNTNFNNSTKNTKHVTTLKEYKHKNKKIWNVETDSMSAKIDAETGNLIQILSKKQEYSKSDCTEMEAINIAKELYKNLDIEEKYKEYELNGLLKFDEELWIANFSKKYENLYNDYESVKLTFAPSDNEIKIISIISDGVFNNNSIEISENVAIKIAKQKTNLEDNCNVELKIVKPNYFFADNENYLLYKSINEIRIAYVIQFEDEKVTTVYVDATTGEVIGGDIKV